MPHGKGETSCFTIAESGVAPEKRRMESALQGENPFIRVNADRRSAEPAILQQAAARLPWMDERLAPALGGIQSEVEREWAQYCWRHSGGKWRKPKNFCHSLWQKFIFIISSWF
jgi:hypothetical protein